MIEAVRAKINESGWAQCIQENLFFQEQGRGVKLTPKGLALKLKVDDGLITDTKSKKCDCLYFYEHNPHQHYVFLVELKGTHYADALAQLAATYQHPHCMSLVNAAQTNKKPIAVAIVGAKAKTNRPSKDEWENTHKLRLHVKAMERDSTYNLIELVKPN